MKRLRLKDYTLPMRGFLTILLLSLPFGLTEAKNLSGAVAVVPSSGNQDADLGWRLVDMVTSLLGETKRVTVVERARLEEVLKEQELWAAGAVTDSEAVQLGKLLGATYTCVISVEEYSRGFGTSLSVSLRFVEVESGAVVEVIKGQGSGENLSSAMGDLRNDLRAELLKTFRSGALVDEVETGGRYCVIALGGERGVVKGAFYKALSPGRIRKEKGLLVVEEVFPDYSVARVVRGNVSTGDSVIETRSPRSWDISAFYTYMPLDTLGCKGLGVRMLFDRDCNFFGPDVRGFALTWGNAGAYGVSLGAFKGLAITEKSTVYASATVPLALASQFADGYYYQNALYGFEGAIGFDIWVGNLYTFTEMTGLYLTPFSRWDRDDLPAGDMEIGTFTLRAGFGVRF